MTSKNVILAELKLAQTHMDYLRRKLENFAEPPEDSFTYPLCMYSDITGTVIKFVGLTTGEVLATNSPNLYTVGEESSAFLAHTASAWESVPYNEARGLYDKQLVLVFEDLEYPIIRFYDAINDNCFFEKSGNRNGFDYVDFLPCNVTGDWVDELRNKLEE